MPRRLEVTYKVTYIGHVTVEDGESIEDHLFEMAIPQPNHYMVDEGFDIISVEEDGKRINWKDGK